VHADGHTDGGKLVLKPVPCYISYIYETNNNLGNVYGAVTMASHCESSPGLFDECRVSVGWLPTLRPSQSTWTASPPEKAATVRINHRHLLLLPNLKADTHLPSLRGWKAESTCRHCSKGVQPVPKAVYRSDKHDYTHDKIRTWGPIHKKSYDKLRKNLE